MRYVILICLFFASSTLRGQTMQEAVALFERGQLDSAITISKLHMDTEPGAYQIIGQALVKKGKYNEAIFYLEKGKNAQDAQPSIRAWCMHDLGIAYFMKGDYNKARENTMACIELNATRNSVRSAIAAADLFGLSERYDNWTRKESKHIIFHFQHEPENSEFFIAATEMAFDSINRFFRAILPKKVDYFVWDDLKQAERLFHQPLAFTKTLFCVTHTTTGHTRGHELTHSISEYANIITNHNRLIFEGVASYFDFSGRDWARESHKMVKGHMGKVSLTDAWNHNDNIPELMQYPLGAALTGRLIERLGRDKFVRLLADQSYENAKKIYGPDLDELIVQLEEQINGGKN